MDDSYALLIIDIQKEFCQTGLNAGLGTQNKALCIDKLSQLVLHCRGKGWLIVHVGTKHETIETMPNHLRRRDVAHFCKPGEEGIEFIISPEEGEEVVYKTHYSAFHEDKLHEILDGKIIVFAGVAADCCILHSAFEADNLGFECFVALEAVSASSKEAYIAGLSSITKSAAEIISVEKLLEGKNPHDCIISESDVIEKARSWFESVENTECNPPS